MKQLSKDQLDLLEMLADTGKLRFIPEASALLVSLEELGLIGPDFTVTEAGKIVLDTKSDYVRRRMH